jgi:hypothetical protein
MTRAFVVAAVLGLAAQAHAFSAGITGYSGKPPAQSCGQCHMGGPAPTTVRLNGDDTIFAGETRTFSFDVVTAASGVGRRVGFDVATSAGTLGTVVQTHASRLNGDELTHTAQIPQAATVTLQFTLTAPSAGGPLTLYLGAVSGDGAAGAGGDGVGTAEKTVTVVEPEDLAGVDLFGADFAGVDFAPPPDLSGVDAISSASAPAGDLGRAPPRDEPRWACDCRFGGARDAAPPLSAILFVLGVCLARNAVGARTRTRP